MKKIILSIVLAILAVIAVNAQNKVAVHVTGIDNLKGELFVSLLDVETPLGGCTKGQIVNVDRNTILVVFENVPDGEYMVAMFQDENSNKKLDSGQFGVPVEKYGFSRNVDPAQLGRPPLFDECKFAVSGDIIIPINLVSAIKE